MSKKNNNKKNHFAPDDDTVNSRVIAWEDLFKRYENCNDKNDEGYDMDTLVAIADAEDSDEFEHEYEEEYNPEKIDTNLEAIEEIEEINFENENDKNFANSREKLTFYFTPEFLQQATKDYQKRSKELEKRNLPYWNVRKDEFYHETYNKHSNGFTSSRNYESNTTASIGQLPNSTVADPRQDLTFLSNTAFPSFKPETFKLPPEIHQYIQNNSVVNVKIREYDLTVCKDPLSSSISIQIPTINSVQALPAPVHNENVQNFKAPQNQFVPDPAVPQKNNDKNNSESKTNSDVSSSHESSLSPSKKENSRDSSFEPSQPKKLRENSITDYDIDDIKMTDISTAGSSLSTEDDDLYFIGGAARVKLRRLNHRLKKFETRREERREKLKLAAIENEAAKKLENIKTIQIDESETSTPDDDDFLEMVGKAIKKHNETILKERKNAEKNLRKRSK